MKIDQHTDPMAYQPDMEITSSAIMEQVLAARAAYDETVYTADDVKQALLQEHLTPEGIRRTARAGRSTISGTAGTKGTGRNT